jgi:Rrf2 family protein
MALNTRFATAIHALVLLAAEPERLHTSEDLARSLRTNSVVVRRILLQLQSAELAVSYKGPGGGSKLARPAKKITLRDVHRAVYPDGLVQSRAVTAVSDVDSTLKDVLGAASRAYEKELEEITLSRLMKQAAKKRKR